jgi:hypothetical protein
MSQVKIPQVKLPETDALAIYNPQLGKWSRGGMGPTWGKKPKIWSQVGPLKNHLSQFVGRHYGGRRNGAPEAIYISEKYDGCVLVDMKTGKEHATLKLEQLLFDRAVRIQRERASNNTLPILKGEWWI